MVNTYCLTLIPFAEELLCLFSAINTSLRLLGKLYSPYLGKPLISFFAPKAIRGR